MKQWKPRFVFKKSDQNGVFLLGLFVFFIGAPQLIATSVPERAVLLPLKRESKEGFLKPYWANHLSDFDLYRMGIGVEEAKRYRNYRGQGQYFRSFQEFRTVLGLEDSATQLDSVLLFPSPSLPLSPTPRKHKRRDLNSASETALQEVNGVGPVLSHRIARYREILGGFVEEQQLYEVYALDTAVVRNIMSRFYLSSEPKVRRMNVQQASSNDLAKHPYLSKKQANKLVLHRELQDRALNEEDLRILLDVSNKKFNKIKLYLYFQN